MCDQLKFTSGGESADSLSACFPLRPSPVELHGATMEERLALAVRLARRDLHRHITQSLRDNQLPAMKLERSAPEALPVGQPSPESDIAASQRDTKESCDEADEGSEGGERERKGEGGQDVCSEITCLNMALAQQIQRLKKLCVSVVEGVEEEEEESRERQLTAKQVSVLARKLYDLQRQVSIANGARKGGAEAIARLAPVLRAATRTLNSFSSTHHSLPSQLLKLLGQLCVDSQSSQLLALAQTYSDALRSAREKRQTPLPKTAKARQKKPTGTKRKRPAVRGTGMWQGAKSHYSKPTFSSNVRQKQSSLPRPNTADHRSKSKGREGEVRGKGGKKGIKLYQQEGREEVGMQGPVADALQLHTHNNSPLHLHSPPCSHPHPSPSSQPVPCSPSSSSQPVPCSHPHPSPSSQPVPCSHPHPSPSSQPLPYSPPHPPSSSHPQNLLIPHSHLVLPHLISMATTISHIEEEEIKICRKWNQIPNTATPTASQSRPGSGPTASQSCRPGSGPTASQSCRPGSGPTASHPCLHEKSTFSRPCSELERLADSLLEEVLGGVCSDMESACDSLATQLFSVEFHTAAGV